MRDDPHPSPPDLDLLYRHWHGSASPDERAAVETWCDAAPRHAEVMDALRPGTGAVAQGETWNVDAALVSLHSRMTMGHRIPAARRPRAWGRLAMGVTAAVAIVTAGAIWTTRGAGRIGAPRMSSVTEYATKNGEQTTITLADGTQVRLNVASRLRVPRDFGVASRTVELDGEAQFVVTHNPTRPFVVTARGTLVRDLATEFVVRAYASSAHTIVAVRDGRVAVQSPRVTASGGRVVSPNEVATIGADGATQVTRAASVATYFAWTRGVLTLTDAPAGEALAQLSRWYDLDFRVADSAMLDGRVTLTLPRALDAERLSAIAELFGARATRSGQVVTLIPLGASARPHSSR